MLREEDICYLAVEHRGRWYLSHWHGNVMFITTNPHAATDLPRTVWERESFQATMRKRREGAPGLMRVSAWKIVIQEAATRWASLEAPWMTEPEGAT